MKPITISLRDWKDTDAEALYQVCLDPIVQKNGIHAYGSIRECLETIQRWKHEDGCKVITDSTHHLFIGFIRVSDMNRYEGYAEMEYVIAAQHRSHGYGTQAVRKMLDYGFEKMNLKVIAAWVRSHNMPSARVLEKCSFSLEGRLRKHARDQSDTLCYSILREEWEHTRPV